MRPAEQSKLTSKVLSKLPFDNISWPISPPEHSPKKATVLFVAMLMLPPTLVHFLIGSPLVASAAAIVIAIKIGHILRDGIRIPQTLIIALALLSLFLVIFTYSGWNTQTAGVSFLILLLALKFLEARRLRDYFMVCILLYFVAACSFLYFTGPLDMLIVTAFCCAVTAALIKLTSQDHVKWSTLFGSSSGILLKALPIAILLFFFFPRINANIGFIPSREEAQEQNQLSDTLNAQEFSESAFSDELAFRVEFEGTIPANNKLYWRSKVMPIENNFSWRLTPREQISFRLDSKLDRTSLDPAKIYNYSILHQASKDNFLPYLDYAIDQHKGIKLNDYSSAIRALSPSNFIYSGSSYIDPVPINNSRGFKAKLTEVSRPPTQRIRTLLTQWQQQTGNQPEQLVKLALDYFKDQEFKYSLLPPKLGQQPLDEFLFDSRIGYCSHYASAYSTLMRWLGIPSRVVVGYQGGEVNSAGGYLQVRYSDAHAWSEVWLAGQWQRVDPTAVIRPERIEFGMDALLALLGTQETKGLSRSALADRVTPKGFDNLFRKVSDSFANFGYQWSKWVVNYDADRQKELLAKLGLKPNNTAYFLSFVVIAIIACFSLLYFAILRPKAIKLSRLERDYSRFVTRLENKEFRKAPSDTPTQFSQRAIEHYPKEADKIQDVIKAYTDLRYSKKPKISAEKFRAMSKTINPKK